jgi:AraC family transcriptional regulator, ethanolamine operon transcriptional activator
VSEEAAPPVRRERVFSADLDALEDIPGWRFRCLQVSRGELAGHSVDLHLPAIQVLFEEYRNVATNQFGCGPPGTITFGVAVSMQGTGILNGIRWSDGLSAFNARCEFDSIVMPTHLISIVVDHRCLGEHLWHTEHADIEYWLSDGPAVTNDASLGAGLAQQLRPLVEGADERVQAMNSPAMRQRVQQDVMDILGPSIADRLHAARPSRSEAPHFGVVRRAREHLRAHQDDPPSIGQLCRALGVSRRWLQLSFSKVLQIGPHAYLRAMRLCGARRMLAKGTAGTQVKDAVEAFGFWHLSRFSHDYRGLFGELPSQTLQRARRRA